MMLRTSAIALGALCQLQACQAPSAVSPGPDLAATVTDSTRLADDSIGAPTRATASREQRLEGAKSQIARILSPWLAVDVAGRLRCHSMPSCGDVQNRMVDLVGKSVAIGEGTLVTSDFHDLVSIPIPRNVPLPLQNVSSHGNVAVDAAGNLWGLAPRLAHVPWLGPWEGPQFRKLEQGPTIGCGITREAASLECWRGGYKTKREKIKTPRWQSLSIGQEHVCALSKAGKVLCWGDASYGQLGFVAEKKDDYAFDLEHGVQRFVQSRPRKVFLDLPTPVKEIYATGFMTCAWLDNNDLWCWGNTEYFHLRDTMAPETHWSRMTIGRDRKNLPVYKPTFASTLPSSPLKMPANCTPKDVNVASGRICVVCESGCAQCWGYNQSNALGYGDSKESWAPRNECLEF